MSRPPQKPGFRLPRSIALLVLAVGASSGRAQYADWSQFQENPEWTYFVPRLKYLDMDVEAEQDTYRSTGGGGQAKDERLYLSPRVGIGWNNYIYHPYLLTYSLLFEPGYVWEEEGTPGAMSQTEQLMLNGNLTLDFLEAKPYATTLFYDRAHEETKYDFFNTAMVDSEGWGGSTGYREGPVPVNLSFQQSHEDSTGLNQDSTTDQTTINLHARNEREKEDATDLAYQYGQFDRETDVLNASYRDENSYHHVTLTDLEHFTRSTLNSTVLFNEIQSDNAASTDLNTVLNYGIEHTPRLHSFYNYSFSWYDGNGSDSMQHDATVGIQHQLYESLSSAADIHGSMLNDDADGSTLDTKSGGAGASENYSKRLGHWAHLSIGDSADYDATRQDSSGGELLVANESHTVPPGGLVVLGEPRDLSVVTVTDSTGTITLQPGLDYTLNQATDPWQIQVNSAGPNHIAPGQAISATYTVQSNPSGSYSTFNNQAQVRLDFWHDRAGIYARYNLTDNHADSPAFVLENVEEFQAGADFNWGGFRAQADYTDRQSTLYDFRSFELSESYAWKASTHSSLGINLNQQWSVYPAGSGTSASQTESVSYYNSMAHYEWRPTAGLSWTVEGGVQQQRGGGFDQDLFAARTYLNWSVGKLQVHLGYEHEDQTFSTETRQRDFAFLRIRRIF